MSSLGKKTSLIVQESAMIPQMETPTLRLDGYTRVDALALVPPTVRFLRCGCPSVQWLIISERFDSPKVADVIRYALRNLQMPSENFKVNLPEVWKLGTVITITRTVEPKIAGVTFGTARDFRGMDPETLQKVTE